MTAIEVTMQRGFGPLIYHRSWTELQGKFSAEYVVAAALLDSTVSLSSFTHAAVQRPMIQPLAREVSVSESPVPPVGPSDWNFAYAVLEVRMKDRTYCLRVDVPRGNLRRPLTWPEPDGKLFDAVGFAHPGGGGRTLLAEVEALPECPVLDGFAWR